jgi:hypothetical protein
MPTFNTVPANPLDYANINNSFASAISGDSFRTLEELEATNVDNETITQRSINMKSSVKVFGPVAAIYTRDFKASAFSTDAPALSIPGATVSFELEENCDNVQFMYQLSWQGLIGPPPEDGNIVFHPAQENQRANLWIYLDGVPTIWQTAHRLPYSVSRLSWGGARGKAEPYDTVGPAGNIKDVDPARQRTVSGFLELGSLQAGVHHVSLNVWYKGDGVVRIRSSQVAVIARYR